MTKAQLVKELKASTPKTINVLGVPFAIKFNHKVPASEKGTYAVTIGEDREIIVYVRRITSAEQFKSTLIHELLHAALHVSGVTNMLVEEQEEAVVVALESFLSSKELKL